MQKIYFSFPGFYSHFELCQLILNLYHNNNEYFYEDVVLDTFYDSFPCIWNGGRVLYGGTSLANIKQTLQPFADIGLRYTFTNALLEPIHFTDTLCNTILAESAHSAIKTGITLNSSALKEYIENHYPDSFTFNWSATKVLEDIDEINELTKTNIVIPSYQWCNNNFDILSKFSHPNNIELIVDEGCNDNCPYRKTHYLEFNKAQLYQTTSQATCVYNNSTLYYNRKTGRKHNITITDIREKYLPLGFHNFKITGREDNNINLIESFILYFIKPQYQNKVRNFLLLSLYEEGANVSANYL